MENINDLKKYKDASYHQLSQPQYTAVFFNQKKNELLQADYIRQALALAIDKDKIVKEVYKDSGHGIDSVALPGIETPSDIKKYSFDPQTAAELLEKNGWSLTSTTTGDGLNEEIRKKKTWFLTITLTVADHPQTLAVAKIIKDDWERIGVKTTIQAVDKTRIIQEIINNRRYEALLFSENLGFDPDPFVFWHSSQSDYPGLNLAGYASKPADTLLEKSRQTATWEERQKNYQSFMKLVAADLPAIFLYSQHYVYVQRDTLHGFDISTIAEPSDRFANISEWHVKTKRVRK
jgi:ABC-type transport system substrate-binding protein